MKKKTPKLLFNFEAQEVSLVDKGANGKKFFLMKSQGEGEMDDLVKILDENKLENEDVIDATIAKANISKEAASAAKAALRILNAFKKEMPKDIMKMLSELSGFGIGEDEKEMEEMKKQFNDRIEKALKYINEENKENFTLIMKGEEERKVEELSKEAKEKIEKMEEEKSLIQKQLDEANAEKQAMIEKQERQEFIAKAEKFEKISNKELVADILQMIQKSGDEEKVKAVQELFAAANAQIEANDKLTKELGTSNDSELKAEEKIEKMVNEKVEKESMSYEKAYSKVLEENPELYKQYLDKK